MSLKRIHHVAYRCRDARETVHFYRDLLGMEFKLAMAEDSVPSTGEPDPYMHVFMEAGSGNVLAFFEVPNSPDMDRDRNTPEWVQHIAFEVGSFEEGEFFVSDNGAGNLDSTLCSSFFSWGGVHVAKIRGIPLILKGTCTEVTHLTRYSLNSIKKLNLKSDSLN